MFTDTHPRGELSNECVTATCLAHQRKVWTGGDAHEWRHTDNKPCAAQRTTHSATCRCWDCQSDPFAGIPQADEPIGNQIAAALARVMAAEADSLSAFAQADLFDVATAELVEPGMQAVLF